MTRRSRVAVGRSVAADRWLVLLVGLLAVAVAAAVLAVGFGLLGSARAGRPVLDPIALGTVETYPNVARIVTVALGALLLLLGLLWALKAIRPERQPTVLLDPATPVEPVGPAASASQREPSAPGGPGGVASAAGLAELVAADASSVAGVRSAKAKLVGPDGTPALRLTLGLAPDADPQAVCEALEAAVLAPARARLAVDALPTAVQLQLAR